MRTESVMKNLLSFCTLMGVTAMAVSAPLRFAATEMPKPDPCMPFISETAHWLEKYWPEGVTFQYYTVKDLEKAVQNREVDVVLSEGGVAAILRREGARPMVTAISKRHPNPEKSQGSVIFVRDDNVKLRTWKDLSGTHLAATSPKDFSGYQAAMGELVKRGYQPDKFFSQISLAGSPSKLAQQSVVDKVLSGEAEVGIVRTCFLEDLSKSRGQTLKVRVIEPYADEKFACQRSTALYPNWTISLVPSLNAEQIRIVMGALFDMPETSNGMFWSFAPSFNDTEKVMKELHIGPYEFLDTWSVRRLWEEYKSAILLLLFALLGLLVHTWRTESLVNRRTSELTQAFQREKELRNKVWEKESELDRYQRATIAGQISNMFAHELKQPLHSMQCYSHALLRLLDRGETDSAKYRNVLERIKEDSAFAGQMVDKVRDYAKGRGTRRESLDLVEQLQWVLEHESQKHGISYVFEHSVEKAVLTADPLEIKLILVNVVKNAFEATKTGAGTPCVEARIGMQGECWQIAVRDSGAPLSAERFSQLSVPLMTTKSEGTGFGLMIVRGLLTQLGGELVFERLEGGGLEVRVSIPRQCADCQRTIKEGAD